MECVDKELSSREETQVLEEVENKVDQSVIEVSKKVSWILRHGLHSLDDGDIDDDGFVEVKTLLEHHTLKDFDYDNLIAQINISNEQKKRYDVKEENGKVMIRATKDRPEKKKKTDKVRGERNERGDGVVQSTFGKGRGFNSKGSLVSQGSRDGSWLGPSSRSLSGAALTGDVSGRTAEDDRPPKGRGKQTHRPPPDRSSWGQTPKDASQVGKAWVVANNQPEVLVREGFSVKSPVKYTIEAGQVVTQTGPDEDDGTIVRMEISFKPETSSDEQESAALCTGWVTKTAEAINGPRFFYPFRQDAQNRNRADTNISLNGNKSRQHRETANSKTGGETSDGDTDGRSPKGNVNSARRSFAELRDNAPKGEEVPSHRNVLPPQTNTMETRENKMEEDVKKLDLSAPPANLGGRNFWNPSSQHPPMMNQHNMNRDGRVYNNTSSMGDMQRPTNPEQQYTGAEGKGKGGGAQQQRPQFYAPAQFGPPEPQSYNGMYHPAHGFPPQFSHLGYMHDPFGSSGGMQKGKGMKPGGGGYFGAYGGAGFEKNMVNYKGGGKFSGDKNFGKGKITSEQFR